MHVLRVSFHVNNLFSPFPIAGLQVYCDALLQLPRRAQGNIFRLLEAKGCCVCAEGPQVSKGRGRNRVTSLYREFIRRAYTSPRTAHKFTRPVHSFSSSSGIDTSLASGCEGLPDIFTRAVVIRSVKTLRVVDMLPSGVVRWGLKTQVVRRKNAQHRTHASKEQMGRHVKRSNFFRTHCIPVCRKDCIPRSHFKCQGTVCLVISQKKWASIILLARP